MMRNCAVLTCTRTAQYTARSRNGSAPLCAKHYYQFTRAGEWVRANTKPLDSFMGKNDARESEAAVLDAGTRTPK